MWSERNEPLLVVYAGARVHGLTLHSSICRACGDGLHMGLVRQHRSIEEAPLKDQLKQLKV